MKRASPIVAWMDRRFYPTAGDHWDDVLFREVVLGHVRPSHTILDLGAGAGIVEQMNFRGVAARVCGIDLDPRVVDNPFLDEARIAGGAAIPYPDATFDVVFSDNVLEHLDDPLTVFNEVFRVLAPGGAFLVKTPNRTHYVTLLARLTPLSFHRFVNRLRGRAELDTFPTRYRANSAAQLEALAESTGFRVEEARLIEGRPEYLRISPLLYPFGVAYERIVNATSGLERFRVLLVAALRKPETSA